MTESLFENGDLLIRPLSNRRFGIELSLASDSLEQKLSDFARHRDLILQAYHQARGLMLIRDLQALREHPMALVELSRHFGDEVENYRQTLTSERFYHDSIDEILILTNAAPCFHPPPPKSGLDPTDPTSIQVQFPRQLNWHTDQSYRRPPPDISLLFSVESPPPHQGRTLYADCTAAYQALSEATRQRLHGLEAIHAPSWIGRSRQAVEKGEPVLELLPHQLPQKHPILRRHPVTGEAALYICEEKQLDYVDGPVAGLTAGPNGEGAEMIRELLSHATDPRFVYVHEWRDGDLVIGDNRCQLHCATWYDAERHRRLMWRTTVMGNPGSEYAGEAKSWLPRDGSDLMAGMEHA